MRTAITFLAAALVLPLTAQLLTAEQAVQVALEHNHGIRLAKLDARTSELMNNIGNAGMLPTVDANGVYSLDNSSTKQTFFSGEVREASNANSRVLDGALALNWTVFDGLAMFAAKDRLEALELIGKTGLRQRMESTVYDVLTNYYLAVQLNSAVAVQQEGLHTSRERLTIARTAHGIGSGSGLQVVQARLDLSADSAALLGLMQQRTIAFNRLNTLLGRAADTPAEVGTTIPAPEDLDLATVQKDARAGNSAVQQARQQQLLADVSVKELRGALFPRIDLFGNYGYTKSTSAVGFLKSNQALGPDYGVRVNVPLFRGLQANRALEVAKITREQASVSTEQAQLQLEQQVLDGWSDYSTARQRVLLEETDLAGIRTQVGVALESYRIGVITSVELRDVQQGLIAAENRLLLAQYEAKSAELRLKWLAGRLL
ncbi:MAG: TolC family protein [Bacteroidetes bacterium]|nr:TolC family protein [Bacteroidota bacterium]MCC6655630.1 TolC family protein [Flavobacteriales bacterium]HMU14814.1 TolC family protein [Flavobacteriales bacterium]HMW97452.1 TolC family protein [Flavobacteriales bacterium]HNK84072.1 TolC family protein [Flavobacteriales bacterium]